MSNQKYQSMHFDKNFSQWWDFSGDFSLLHKISPVRNEYILNNIKDYFNNKNFSEIKLLDIGCGGGIASSYFAKRGFDVTGIDPNPSTIEAAQSHMNLNNFKASYINSDLYNFTLNNKKQYDVLLCLEILEHIPDLTRFLSLFPSILNTKGLLIISTINKTLTSYLKIILLCEYILKIIPKKTHQYNKFLKPSRIHNLIQELGFEFIRLDGLNFNICSGEFFFSKKIDSNYFLIYYKK